MASAKQKIQSISEQDDAAAEMDEPSKEAKEAPEAGSSKVDGAGKCPEENLQQLNTNMTTLIETITSAKQKVQSISEPDDAAVEMDEYWNEAQEALEAGSSKVDGAGKFPKETLQQMGSRMITLTEQLKLVEGRIGKLSDQDQKCRNKRPIAIPEPPSPDTFASKPLLAELMKSIGQLTVERDTLQVKLRNMASEIKVHNPKSRVRKKAQAAITDVTSAFDIAKRELRSLEEEAASLVEPFDELTDDVQEFRFIRKLREQLESDELVLFRYTGKE